MLRGLGNAIVPQIAAEFVRAYMADADDPSASGESHGGGRVAADADRISDGGGGPMPACVNGTCDKAGPTGEEIAAAKRLARGGE